MEVQSGEVRAGEGCSGPWKRRLLALGIALGLALVAAEALVRAVHGTPLIERLPILWVRANEARGWEMLPGLHYTYHHPARVNSHGLRGPEIGPKKGVRVLALGDSLIYGQGVGEEETLPHYLEEALNASEPTVGRAGRRFEVINGGHRAFDTRQELSLCRELCPELEPDLVLLFWYWNDVKEHNARGTYVRLAWKPPVTFDTRDDLSGLSRLRWRGMQIVRRSALAMYTHDLLGSRRGNDPFPDEMIEQGVRQLGTYLDRFLELSERFGFELMLAPIPDARTVGGSHYSSEIVTEAERLARERGIPVIGLLGALEELASEHGGVPLIPYDGHYAPEANLAMAREVAARVLEASGR